MNGEAARSSWRNENITARGGGHQMEASCLEAVCGRKEGSEHLCRRPCAVVAAWRPGLQTSWPFTKPFGEWPGVRKPAAQARRYSSLLNAVARFGDEVALQRLAGCEARQASFVHDLKSRPL